MTPKHSKNSVSGRTCFVINVIPQKATETVLHKCNRRIKTEANWENWKNIKNIKLRNINKSQNGKITKRKNADEKAFKCGCNFNCATFNVEDIKKNYAKFKKMNYDEQSSHLASLIELNVPKRRRVKDGTSRRNVSANYFLLKSNKKRQRVCKKMICHTFQVTQRRVQILVDKLKTGSPIADQRGKHTNRPHKIIDVKKEIVIEDIQQ